MNARYPVLEVLWLDSAQLERGDWIEVPDPNTIDDLEQRSTGYLIAETDHSIALARSISEWTASNVEKVEGVLCIPKSAITTRTELRKASA